MEVTLDQALQKGVEAHKAGKVREADRYYTAILKANPKHPDANHNMGILAVGVGRVDAALPFFKTALEANSSIAQFWLSYIDALINLDRLEDAKAMFDQARQSGAKGEKLDELELRLNILNQVPTEPIAEKNELEKNPPQDLLKPLINLYNQGQFQRALDEVSKLLLQFSKSVILYNLSGAANSGLGHLDAAIVNYKKALAIRPDYADAHNNIGGTFKEQGKLEEAIEAYNKALVIKPDFAEAYYNMGNALQEQGKLEEAIVAYKKALVIKPDYGEVYNNMGNARQEQGKLEEAIEAYNKALSIKPDFAEAYYNMGNARQEQGKLEEAILAYNKALSIKPDYAKVYNNMGLAIQGNIFNKPNRDLQKTIVSLLDKKTSVRPKDIAQAAISLLKLEPNLRKNIQLVDTEIVESLLDVISDLTEFPLLLKLMSVCPLPDLELEGLLTKLRCSILLNISSIKVASLELIGFQSALALQCFTNEYIYNNTEEEEELVKFLEASVGKDLESNDQPSPQIILALASYKALNKYEWFSLLVVTDDIQEVFSRQVVEPNEEEKLKKDLPVLQEVTDIISSEVREQYEESPYPRWVNLGLSFKPMSISNVVDHIKLKLHDNKINEVEKPEILIAGCGTGQHSIGTATRFKSSKVLAIDLSLSSLAYAKRKTEYLGIKNISYMQADILDLSKLNKQFDIIESAGVLHHMDSPMAGWQVLTDCLKPGGLMKIGLYSELARQHIVKIRQETRELGIGSSKAEMRAFRNMIIESDKGHHKQVLRFPDFYSLSELRDLLFHVQEHRFTIPQIKDHLDRLGLKFCGFEMDKIDPVFKQTHTHQDDPYDLNKWQAYEEAFPPAFTGMYQFWCQKVD